MSDGTSPVLAVVLIGGAFGGGFLLLLFMLWASGRSPIVRIGGELAATLLYLAMANNAGIQPNARIIDEDTAVDLAEIDSLSYTSRNNIHRTRDLLWYRKVF